MKLFLIDGHSIFRRGLATCLTEAGEIETIDEAASVDEAWANAALRVADVVIVDAGMEGAVEFIRSLRRTSGAHIMVCCGATVDDRVFAVAAAGAVGYLQKETLTPRTLVDAVRVAATGHGVFAPHLMEAIVARLSGTGTVSADQELRFSLLTEREQAVLRLLADGHPIRQVAIELNYSERTIKSVIHDIVTKLNVKTRSQAVAQAVRSGLI